MLDFYLIKDSQPTQSEITDLEYLGGIREALFSQLQTEGIIEPRFDFYSDFRWGSEMAARMLVTLQKRLPCAPQQMECKSFIALLHKAVGANGGLLAVGD
ncbi:hypothetical protein [Hymenobacter gelipurpurascens]|uniref:hypothetical protein n=1 Tax=Hymenobacter gelipurpurascens TaxID=89968 RepID=UPI000B5900C7|nr:hypothetical protein [Hymenobacter gelipurpurascens]